MKIQINKYAMGAMGLEHATEIYILKNEYISGARPRFLA